MPDFLTAKEAADALRKSRVWVYRHASALGAFQPHTGCALSFPAAVIEQIKEGRYAVPNGKREMAGAQDDRGRPENQDVQHKSVGKKMGGRAKSGRLAKGKREDPYGLLA
jgi:hypothetical protein